MKSETFLADLLIDSLREGELAESIIEQVGDKTIIRVQSFDDAGIMTRDEGLVLKINEVEYQITIVRR